MESGEDMTCNAKKQKTEIINPTWNKKFNANVNDATVQTPDHITIYVFPFFTVDGRRL